MLAATDCGGITFSRPKPAAWVINWPGSKLYWAFLSMYVYEPEEKKRAKSQPQPTEDGGIPGAIDEYTGGTRD